jgi:FtsH-binding integral membrane protein
MTRAQVLLMGLSERARRNHPWNLLGLGVFVACEALLVGTATAALDTPLLLLAVGMAGAITLGLVGFALQTRWAGRWGAAPGARGPSGLLGRRTIPAASHPPRPAPPRPAPASHLRRRYDLTASGGILLAALLALLAALLAGALLPYRPTQVITSALAALLFSAYVVYDVQLLAGGEHMFALGPDEYVFGALNLYLDVMNLFLHLLRLLQLGGGDR